MGIVFSALLCRPPIPVDETRYLSVAWEMWQSHQFLVPHINGIPYSHKPPLLFWLIQAGWKIFGVNSWSARLTAPLFGLFSILLTRHLARLLWPERKRLHALIPYIFLGTLFWSFYSSLTMFDVPMAFFSLMAWSSLWKLRQGHQQHGWMYYAIAIGLGILTKGPVILVYTIPPALLAPWWMDRKTVSSWTKWYTVFFFSVAAGILIALAWALPAAKTGGALYGHTLFFGQTAGRIVHSFAHQRPFFWYILLLPILLFPWVLYPSIWSAIRTSSLSMQDKFCISILLPGFCLLSAISGKQIHYLLPLLPAAILLIAKNLSHGQAISASRPRALPVMLLIFSLILAILPLLPFQGGDSGMLHLVPPWLGLIPLMTAYVLYKKKASRTTIAGTAATLAGMLILFHLALAVPLHTMFQGDVIGKKIHAAQTAGKQVAVYPARMADQFQFAGRLTSVLVPQLTIKNIFGWSQTHTRHYVLLFLGKKEYPFFSHTGTVLPVGSKRGIFRSSKEMAADYHQWKTEQVSAKK